MAGCQFTGYRDVGNRLISSPFLSITYLAAAFTRPQIQSLKGLFGKSSEGFGIVKDNEALLNLSNLGFSAVRCFHSVNGSGL